jgi:hypothetical protein
MSDVQPTCYVKANLISRTLRNQVINWIKKITNSMVSKPWELTLGERILWQLSPCFLLNFA